MKKNKTKRYVISAVVIIALLAIILVPMRIFSKNKVTEVRTGTASKGNIVSYLTLTAAIESQNKQNVYAMQQLKVLDIPVNVGDTVKKGDVLITFDVSAYTKAYNDAKKAYDDTNKKIDDTTSEITALTASKDPTKLALVSQKQTALAALQSTLAQAKNGYEQAKAAKEALKSEIVADFDGVVSSINIEKGAITAMIATQPAITVTDTNNLSAVINASRYDVDKIEIGQPVSILYNNKTYTGSVAKKAPVAEKVMTSNGTESQLKCTIAITGDTKGLIIGFDADAQIKTGEIKNVIKVPAEAVNKEKRDYFVYVLKSDNTLEKRKVTVGLQSEAETEIKNGITVGEKVVLNPDNTLYDGMKVREKD